MFPGALRYTLESQPMTSPRPGISVVTICRNAADALERTLESVRAQDYPALEHVVVDGASMDRSLAILQRHRRPGLHFTSEPDRGIAHAFNKGIAASTAPWILMLNAGDVFIGNDALRLLADAMEDSALLVSARARCGTKVIPRYRIHDGVPLLFRAHLSHQATLVHRDLYARYGGYDESFRIRMDFDFFLRVLPHEKPVFLDRELVDFEPGGISGRQFLLHWQEGRRALSRNRAGIAARMQYEAAFCVLSCERALQSAVGK
jgi:glycosyltransferase involved in cell wall biosynthesis